MKISLPETSQGFHHLFWHPNLGCVKLWKAICSKNCSACETFTLIQQADWFNYWMLTESVVSHLGFGWVTHCLIPVPLTVPLSGWDAGGRGEVETVWLLFLEGLEAMTCLLCCRAQDTNCLWKFYWSWYLILLSSYKTENK